VKTRVLKLHSPPVFAEDEELYLKTAVVAVGMQLCLFEKILVPLDGSEHSVKALQMAIQIAKKFGGKLTLFHVYSITVPPIVVREPTTLTPSGAPVVTPAEVSKMFEAARDVGKRILDEGERNAVSEGVKVESMLREGNSVQEIVRLAKEGNFDLIVMGVRGVSKLRELLLGSVSEGVMKHAPCPVLVVK
jgi:nucleotide-binding universal stress UspA family protein